MWGIIESRVREEGGGDDMWEGIQDTEASASVLWRKSKGGTTFTEVGGGKTPVSLFSPVSKCEMVRSASVSGRFHSSRANTHTHKYTLENT